MANRHITTAGGTPISDNQNSMTAGERGPIVFEDFHLFEKLAHFNRERIPERVVHAKGSGAFGELTITRDITKYTKAKLFGTDRKRRTPLFLRLSTVGGEAGSADTERDPRGFAIKFYTEEGIWDLVGNNTPVFFLRDPSKFPDFIHTQKRHPQTHTKNATMQWDFWSLHPESLHQVTILFSDRGIPDGYRFMDGFGSHTFSMVNAKGERFFVKYHFKTKQGIKNLAPGKAVELAGTDPDYAQRDLYEAIERKDFPAWTMAIQVMTEAEAAASRVNPFDVTKIWSHKSHPRIDVGEIVLNRNPTNYFADVEQAAFAPSSIVPGLGFSPDRMLQGRLFAYADAHRYRLGVNYHQIPVNRPTNTVRHYHRDGGIRVDGNGGATHNYHPNSFDEVVARDDIALPPYALTGAVGRHDHRADEDYYSQAGDLFRLMNADQRSLLREQHRGRAEVGARVHPEASDRTLQEGRCRVRRAGAEGTRGIDSSIDAEAHGGACRERPAPPPRRRARCGGSSRTSSSGRSSDRRRSHEAGALRPPPRVPYRPPQRTFLRSPRHPDTVCRCHECGNCTTRPARARSDPIGHRKPCTPRRREGPHARSASGATRRRRSRQVLLHLAPFRRAAPCGNSPQRARTRGRAPREAPARRIRDRTSSHGSRVIPRRASTRSTRQKRATRSTLRRDSGMIRTRKRS